MAFRRMSWDLSCPNSGRHEDIVMRDMSLQPWNPSSTLWNTGRQISSWLFSKSSDPMGTLDPSYSSGYHDGVMKVDHGHESSNTTRFISYINALPIELLGDIFFHYTFSTGDLSVDYEDHVGDRRRGWKSARFQCVGVSHKAATNPMILGQVCAHWRTLSKSMPNLWSTITVTHPTSSDIPAFEAWLDRSGSRPLNLTIKQASYQIQDAAIEHVSKIAGGHRHRWRTLSLQLHSNAIRIRKALLVEGEGLGMLPVLEGFNLSLFGCCPEEAESWRDILYSAPRLNKVGYGSMPTGVNVLRNAPLSGITSLSLPLIPTSQLFNLLSTCGNLAELSIAFLDGLTDVELLTPLLLPNLRSLSLSRARDITGLLEHLTLPSLQKLHLLQGFGFGCCPLAGQKSLTSFLERSGAQLRSFSISGLDDHEQVLLEIIRSPSCASLTDLTVKSAVTDHTLIALTQLSTPLDLLPTLSTLSLWCCCSTDGILSEMILSRKYQLREVDAGRRGSCRRDRSLHIPDLKLDITSDR